MVRYVERREHCTKFGGTTSSNRPINASIVQGSGIGPFAYVITASDLHPVIPDNSLNKYADDSYLIVPSKNSNLISSELAHIEKWADEKM